MAVTKTIAATRAHIRAVTADTEFTKALASIDHSPTRSDSVTKLLKKYGLELSDFDIDGNGFEKYINPNGIFSAGRLEYEPTTQEFTARFDATLTKNQLLELWGLIVTNQQLNGVHRTKQKEPENIPLLFAVFKARWHYSFSQIFSQYQSESLLGYSGSATQFKSEDSLERYYRRYYHTK